MGCCHDDCEKKFEKVNKQLVDMRRVLAQAGLFNGRRVRVGARKHPITDKWMVGMRAENAVLVRATHDAVWVRFEHSENGDSNYETDWEEIEFADE